MLGVLAFWLLGGQRGMGQGSFIVHTTLTNPNPDGFFGPDGMPVYSPGGGGPYSTLPIDLNHDGTEEFRAVATGTVTWGFQMEGADLNAVWSRPTGGSDFGAWVVPHSLGITIGPSLPVGDEWTLTYSDAFGINGPTLSAYSSAGALGLFVDHTAFAGLQFRIGADLHYGWIRIQEIPALAGGGIVYEYAYDIRPGQPILAGAVPEPSACALLITGGLLATWLRKKVEA